MSSRSRLIRFARKIVESVLSQLANQLNVIGSVANNMSTRLVGRVTSIRRFSLTKKNETVP